MKKYNNLEVVLLLGEVISATHTQKNPNFQRRNISQGVKHSLISSLAFEFSSTFKSGSASYALGRIISKYDQLSQDSIRKHF